MISIKTQPTYCHRLSAHHSHPRRVQPPTRPTLGLHPITVLNNDQRDLAGGQEAAPPQDSHQSVLHRWGYRKDSCLEGSGIATRK